MFCPNCGSKNLSEQNFCRFCGLNLEVTSKSLKTQIDVDKKGNELNKFKKIKKYFDFASWCSFGIMFSSVFLYIFLTLMNINFPRKNMLIGMFIAFSIYKIIDKKILSWFGTRKEQISNIEENKFKVNETTELIEEKPFPYIPSYTENSTQLLYDEHPTKKL